MKRRNPTLAAILALLIPFYYYFWWYDTARRLEAKGITRIPSLMPILSVLVVYTSLIIGTSFHIEAGRSTETNPPTSFYIALGLIPLLYILQVIYLVGFVRAANQVAKRVTIRPALMVILFFLLPPAGVYIYQKQFNGAR